LSKTISVILLDDSEDYLFHYFIKKVLCEICC